VREGIRGYPAAPVFDRERDPRAFHDNRSRVRRTKGKKLLRLRGERIERTFALACETGAHRRVRLRGRDNARKRYMAHVAALNLGLVMRTLFGHGTPRQAAAAVLLALIVALRIAYEKIAGFSDRIVGTLLPHPGARHRVDGLAA
jgi:hypothetical protein